MYILNFVDFFVSSTIISRYMFTSRRDALLKSVDQNIHEPLQP